MIKINIHESQIILDFQEKSDVSTFLQNERDFFEFFWYNFDKISLISENKKTFGNNIRTTILDNYNVLINGIHEPLFNISVEVSNYFKEKKLFYSKSSFSLKLQEIRTLKMPKLAIYMIGIYTQSIKPERNETLNTEIFEFAKNKMNEYYKFHKKEVTPYKVLVIDGGGILGYYEASLLSAFDNYFNKEETDIGKSFDMICGTSTGAILASGLAQGLSLLKIKDLYKENAKDIFPNPTPEKGFSLYRWFFKHLNKPSASQKTLKKLLNEIFNEQTLLELWKEREIALCIPTLFVNTHTPIVFKTPHNKNENYEYQDLRVQDACLASSAAPIFFPLAEIKENEYYTDGGLWANNPILIGLTEALKMVDEHQTIEIYSLSPPINNEASIEFIKTKKQGIAHWKVGIEIVNMSLFAQSQGYNNIAHNLGDSFSKLGQRVKIINFIQGNPGKEYLTNFGLDRNNEETFLAMDSLIKNIVNTENLSKFDIVDVEKIFVK